MEKEKILEVKDLKVSFQTFQGSVQAVPQHMPRAFAVRVLSR